MRRYAGCPALRKLVLCGSSSSRGPTDTHAAALASAQGLEILDLQDCFQITERGIAHLWALPNLKTLNLSSLCRLTCGDFSRLGTAPWQFLSLQFYSAPCLKLAHMPRLATLDLPFTGTLKALELEEAEALESLELCECFSFRDSAVECLERLPKLRQLSLYYTGITDAAVPRLSRLPALRELNLSMTEITDAAVPHLARMTNLSELRLDGCKRLTPEGVYRLKAALPQCHIRHESIAIT